MRRVVRSCGSVVLAMAVIGCGARVSPPPIAGLPAEVASTIAPPAGPEAATPGGELAASHGAGETQAGAETEQTPTPFPTMKGPNHNNGVVRIELSATCVRPGDLLIVTVRVPPKAGLGLIIAYSDQAPHGAMSTGESDDTGTFVWRIPVEPTVPPGEAIVLVSSSGANWSQQGGGSGDARFRVAGWRGC